MHDEAMDPALQLHRPSASARALAEAQGFDLDALKLSAPERYKMLNAVPVVAVHAALLEQASAVCVAAFRHHGWFQREGAQHLTLLSFPALTPAERDRLGDALSRLCALPEWRIRHAFYREISDRRGERRQLSLPIAPDAWQGQEALVGPFADQAAAESWAGAQVSLETGLLADAVPHAGAWFSDVFSLEP